MQPACMLGQMGRSTIEIQAEPVAAPPKRRHRWVRITLVAALVGILGFGAYVGWFLSNYQPLGPSHSYLTARVVPCSPGAEVRAGFTLETTGHVPVTVEQIGNPELVRGNAPFRLEEVRLGDVTDSPVSDASTTPFHPFSLTRSTGYGRGQWVVLVFRSLRCPPRRTAYSLQNIPITYRVFGVPRHVLYRLPTKIGFRGTA